MLKRILGGVAVAVGLLAVPLTITARQEGGVAIVSADACAQGTGCCISPGDLCLAGDEPQWNMKECKPQQPGG